MTAPLEHEADARALPSARAIRALAAGGAPLPEGNHRLLCSALSACGVRLGHWDHRIVLWLSGYEPETVATVARWVGEAARRREDGADG